MVRLVRFALILLVFCVCSDRALSAQQPPLDALASWIAVDVPTGYEPRQAPGLAAAMPGWEADRLGNVVRSVGSGSPYRIVACALDRPAYAATQITRDGYLRLHRIGRGSRHPLWDQAFEAQPVRILTRNGPVAGVVARTNGHFAAQHDDETVVDADDLWVDVGAESAEAVAALGIELLDPVIRHLPPWWTAGAVAGPAAGRAVACAVVATLADAADDDPPGGTTHFVLSAGEGFGWTGLSSLVARSEAVDEVLVLAPASGEPVRGPATAGVGEQVPLRPAVRLSRFGAVLEGRGLRGVLWLEPEASAAGSHMELVRVAEAERLLATAASHLNVTIPPTTRWVAAPAAPALRTDLGATDHDALAATLEAFVERHGVPGHEWAVRRLLLESMPGWARERAVVDDMGNVMIEMGPDRDTTVFMAHLDEVGYAIESIGEDGVVTLDAQGGTVDTAWEGQTALLHFSPEGAPSSATGTGDDTSQVWKRRSLAAEAPPPLQGVFLTRADADARYPDEPMRAWFGMSGAELAARGIRVGAAVTSHKDALRLGRDRFVGRGLDDRAGTVALLTALGRIDPDALDHKVIFTWSVHEEGGLIGSEAMARRYAATAERIYSVDTFVSSDTPLESPHFAHTPLGVGPVLRAAENSGISPDAERDRVRRIADAEGIPLQTGLTQGSTDGTTFTFRGAPNQGLSWPGRYSHSPGEVLDLRDLARLVDLIVAVARAS